MVINIDDESLEVFEALASDSRLQILRLISEGEYNLKEIADKLYLSLGMVSRHIKKLEAAGIIKSKFKSTNSGVEKIPELAIEEIYIQFPKKIFPEYKLHTVTLGVGTYTDYQVTPTCGLASSDYVIGELDEPKYFLSPDRMQADIVWFSSGYIEYTVPNYLKEDEKPELLEISLELASEFPISNNNWPSEIEIFINDQSCGSWTIPGNYSDVRGKLNPEWWPSKNSQYGLLKTLRISSSETLMDGEKISDFSLNDIDFTQDLIRCKFATKANGAQGGLTIFGKSFGNYPQDIIYRVYYSDKKQ